MSTYNIGFYEDLTKISFNYHQISTLSLLLVVCNVPVSCKANRDGNQLGGHGNTVP